MKTGAVIDAHLLMMKELGKKLRKKSNQWVRFNHTLNWLLLRIIMINVFSAVVIKQIVTTGHILGTRYLEGTMTGSDI